MSPGEARLWTGIFGVGTLVTVAGTMLATNTLQAMLPATETSETTEFLVIVVFFVGCTVLCLPFDLVGGVMIPAAYENRRPSLPVWFGKWMRSVGIQLAFYSVTFFIYLQIGREIGAPWLVAVFAVLQVSLMAGQELIWQAMTANGAEKLASDSTVFVRHTDQRFVGGITGLPGFESIVIPINWKTKLAPTVLRVLISRRRAALNTGARFRGIVAAMIWNITSFTVAIIVSGAAISSVADLMTVFLWFLLFSFVGLLILPSLNRRSVFALDRQLSRDFSAAELQQAIAKIDELTEQDPRRSASAESVFQPIPCPARRSQALTENSTDHVVAWNVARTALFLSWAFGGPLARAVHCNVGRPELWAMLPAD
jgi:hypothetical protein